MNMKTLFVACLFVVSFGAQAIPPAPPALIYNKIKTSAAQKCKTVQGDIAVTDLKDTDKIKFVLELNAEKNAGVLTVLANGEVQDQLEVSCK